MAAGNISSFIVPLYALGARIVRTQVRGCNHGSSPLPLLPTLPLLLPTAACRAAQVFDQPVLGFFSVSILKEGKILISFFLQQLESYPTAPTATKSLCWKHSLKRRSPSHPF